MFAMGYRLMADQYQERGPSRVIGVVTMGIVMEMLPTFLPAGFVQSSLVIHTGS